MTYEEKLSITIEAIKEARQFTRKGYDTKLHIGTGNGLSRIHLAQLHEILLQLQDDVKIITLKDTPTELKTGLEQATESLDGKKNFFLIEILDSFDGWQRNHLLDQKSKPENLDWINLLKILDVCSDINEKLQVQKGVVVLIPSFPYPYNGRFLDLFPFDTIGTRKNYQQHRWEGAQYLLKEGIVLEVEPKMSDVLDYGNIQIKVDLLKFEDFYKTIKNEFEKRKKSSNITEAKPTKIDITNVEPKVLYNAQKGDLDIEGKKVKLDKDSFRAKLLELLLKDDKSRKKEWSWDEVLERIEDITDPDVLKENKKKFYSACDGLTKHIASKTGINDLLTFNKSNVQINSKYL